MTTLADSKIILFISELHKAFASKGLNVNKLESPVTRGYSQEWDIQDSEGWNYAGFGVKNGSCEYTLASNQSLPFEAQKTIDFVKSEIIRIHAISFSDS